MCKLENLFFLRFYNANGGAGVLPFSSGFLLRAHKLIAGTQDIRLYARTCEIYLGAHALLASKNFFYVEDLSLCWCILCVGAWTRTEPFLLNVCAKNHGTLHDM